MKKPDFRHYWNVFLRWNGWKVFWSACKKGWNAAIGWKIWKKLFLLPLSVSLTLFLVCAAALVWVFLNGLAMWWPSYILYCLSAYSLICLCCRIPDAIRMERSWLKKHPKVEATLKDRELKFTSSLYFQQIINFGYGIFKIVSGVVIGSAWIGADGIYNFTSALIQLFQILRRKKPGTTARQWKSYRFCGVLVLVMHLTLTGIVFQMVNWNRAEDSGEIMIIATAAFAFYKFFSSFIDLAKDRKHTRPIDSSVRMLELAQAIFAMFSLQVGLLHTFGTGESWEHWLNLATGCTSCLLVCATGIYMIHRGSRELKTLQENKNGT